MTQKTPNLNYIYQTDAGDRKRCYACGHDIKDKWQNNCPNCKTWLPNFPTSWIRSATNIHLLRRIALVGDAYLSTGITNELFAQHLVYEGLISVDEKRVKDKTYWNSSPKRRASEYTANLRFLGILDGNKDIGKYSDNLTSLGRKFVKSQNRLEYLGVLSKALLSLKLKNNFSDKTYNNYKFRPIISCLKLLNEIDDASLEQMALSFMVTNEKNSLDFAIEFAQTYKNELNKYFFENSEEFRRVIQGVFLHWLSDLELVEYKNNRGNFNIKLTPIAKVILEEIKTYEPIWFTDVNSAVKTLQNNLKQFNNSNPFDISDFSFFYDVPNQFKKEVIGKLSAVTSISGLDLIKLFNNISDYQLKRLEKIYLENTKHPETLSVELENVIKNLRSGGSWEGAVYARLNILNLKPVEYKKKKIFAKIKLAKSITDSLTGGSRHNPDLLITNPQLMMVDPKKNADSEKHKIRAYDGYATTKGVNTPVLIVSAMPLSQNAINSLQELKMTSVINAESLDILVANVSKLDVNELYNFFYDGSGKGYYINEDQTVKFVARSRHKKISSKQVNNTNQK